MATFLPVDISEFESLDIMTARSGMSKSGYRTQKARGKPLPQPYKVGRRIYFRTEDVDEWLRTTRIVPLPQRNPVSSADPPNDTGGTPP